MVKWGLNGRPVNEDSSSHNYVLPKRRKYKSTKKPLKRETIIQIINNDGLITNSMEIIVLARLVNINNHPISKAKIDVIDNNRLLKTLITSTEGYFTFYGGYIGRYHSFIFKFNGNSKFDSCNRSLVIV